MLFSDLHGAPAEVAEQVERVRAIVEERDVSE
jgi:hypothetical protein